MDDIDSNADYNRVFPRLLFRPDCNITKAPLAGRF